MKSACGQHETSMKPASSQHQTSMNSFTFCIIINEFTTHPVQNSQISFISVPFFAGFIWNTDDADYMDKNGLITPPDLDTFITSKFKNR
jgi:hypothetical protein